MAGAAVVRRVPAPAPPAGAARTLLRSFLAASAAAAVVAGLARVTGGDVDAAPSWVLVAAAVAAGVVVHRRTRRSQDARVLRVLAAATLLLVLGSAVSPGGGGRSLLPAGAPSAAAAVTAASGVLACLGAFWAQVALLTHRRRRVLSGADAFLDAASTVLVLVALAGVLLVPHLEAAGAPGSAVWWQCARVAAQLVLLATTVANGFLLGWGRDTRLWKLTGVFALLTGAGALDLAAAAGGLPAAAAGDLAPAARAAAVVLLVAAVWRPVETARSGPYMTWAQLLAGLDVTLLVMAVLALTRVREVPTPTLVLTAVALGLVAAKVALLFREVLRLLDARRLADTDELTGLLNRRGIFTALHRAHEEQPVHVLLLDLDGFKAVNDTHGHPFGDALLRDTAERLRQLAPVTADVGRLGGDEFVLVVRGAGPADVERLTGRITEALGPRRVGGVDVLVGASIGLAAAARTTGDCERWVPGGELSGAGAPGGGGGRAAARAALRAAAPSVCDDLLRRADEAMYARKRLRAAAAPPR